MDTQSINLDKKTPFFTDTFETALTKLKAGRMMQRLGWSSRGMFIKIDFPREGRLMTIPYIYIRTREGENVPWIASQTDILSYDWVEYS